MIEEPCVSGEDSSSIRLALVVLIGAHSGTGGYSQYSYFTDFYRFLPIFTDFSDFLVSVLPGVLFTS